MEIFNFTFFSQSKRQYSIFTLQDSHNCVSNVRCCRNTWCFYSYCYYIYLIL